MIVRCIAPSLTETDIYINSGLKHKGIEFASHGNQVNTQVTWDVWHRPNLRSLKDGSEEMVPISTV
jgi:hypothetical protein